MNTIYVHVYILQLEWCIDKITWIWMKPNVQEKALHINKFIKRITWNIREPFPRSARRKELNDCFELEMPQHIFMIVLLEFRCDFPSSLKEIFKMKLLPQPKLWDILESRILLPYQWLIGSSFYLFRDSKESNVSKQDETSHSLNPINIFMTSQTTITIIYRKYDVLSLQS